jgi:predicted DNA-binding transcriptional regulator AlpA
MTDEKLEPFVVDMAGLQKLGITYTNQHLIRLEQKDRFPRRLSLGNRRVVWMFSELKDWIAARAANRAADAAERSRVATAGVSTRQKRTMARSKAVDMPETRL